MDQPQFHLYKNLEEALLGFSERARAAELKVGIRETQEALTMATMGLIANKIQFRHALRSLYCTRQEDIPIFDALFEQFWNQPKHAYKSKTLIKNRSNFQKPAQRSIVLMGTGTDQHQDQKESKQMGGAHHLERLRKTDFSKVAEIEESLLEKIAVDLWEQMSKRIRRKFKTAPRGRQVDIRKTIRKNISNGGACLDLAFKARVRDRYKLVILLDVSGSMDKYSFFLLRFILALKTHFKQIEAFLFSTTLVPITAFLKEKDLRKVLAEMSVYADNWSSGTKIGACLHTFNQRHAKKILHGRSITLVLSDGLDTGPPEFLAEELRKIKQRTKKLIWLNPLKGTRDYSPTARGMKAALPEVDVFQSAHNLDSILELENFLTHV